MRTDIDEQKDEIERRLRLGHTRAELCRWLDCKESTLTTRLKKWNLIHLKNQGARGRKTAPSYKPAVYFLSNNGPSVKSHALKLKLWKDGIKEKQCEECGISQWNGKDAPLQLDHVNGSHWDNRLENLRILCANCHCQTDTHSGKNIGKKEIGDVAELGYASDLGSDVARHEGSSPFVPTTITMRL